MSHLYPVLIVSAPGMANWTVQRAETPSKAAQKVAEKIRTHAPVGATDDRPVDAMADTIPTVFGSYLSVSGFPALAGTFQ